MQRKVFVYLERRGEGICEEGLMALDVAFLWAKELGATVEGIWLGPQVPKGLPCAPAQVHWVRWDGPDEAYDAMKYGRAIEHFLQGQRPFLVIFPATVQGGDLASWLAERLGVGVIVGARSVWETEEGLAATRLEFDSRVEVTYLLQGQPHILSLEKGLGDVPTGEPVEPEVRQHHVDLGGLSDGVRLVEGIRGTREVNLRGARAIVAIGAGVSSREVFEEVQRLASVLGAELGATRAAVDAGWVGHERQIGQTGLRVRPDLYVACGISGASQHRVGMMDSGTIVSINVDPQAPIFKFSHYCVVGDLREVIPKLLKILEK